MSILLKSLLQQHVDISHLENRSRFLPTIGIQQWQDYYNDLLTENRAEWKIISYDIVKDGGN